MIRFGAARARGACACHTRYHNDSPQSQVAERAGWVLYWWLFALMAHHGLSGWPDLVVGIPLVLALLYLVCFTAHACYKDLPELERYFEDGADPNGDGTEPESAPAPAPAPEPAPEPALLQP